MQEISTLTWFLNKSSKFFFFLPREEEGKGTRSSLVVGGYINVPKLKNVEYNQHRQIFFTPSARSFALD